MKTVAYGMIVRKSLSLLMIVATCIFPSCSCSSVQPKTYTATGVLVMTKVPTKYPDNVANAPRSTGINANEISAMQSLISMSEQIMKSRDFLFTVRYRLLEIEPFYSDVEISEIERMLSISIVEDTTVFLVKATGYNRRLCYDLATVVCEMLPEEIVSTFDSYALDVKNVCAPILSDN